MVKYPRKTRVLYIVLFVYGSNIVSICVKCVKGNTFDSSILNILRVVIMYGLYDDPGYMLPCRGLYG